MTSGNRYSDVLHACVLEADLAQLRHALGAAKAEGAREHGGPAAAQVPSLPAGVLRACGCAGARA